MEHANRAVVVRHGSCGKGFRACVRTYIYVHEYVPNTRSPRSSGEPRTTRRRDRSSPHTTVSVRSPRVEYPPIRRGSRPPPVRSQNRLALFPNSVSTVSHTSRGSPRAARALRGRVIRIMQIIMRSVGRRGQPRCQTCVRVYSPTKRSKSLEGEFRRGCG